MKNDLELKHDVIAAIQWEPSISACLVDIQIVDGLVSLAGNVNSYADKWEMERAVQRVSGVKALVSKIDVILPITSQRHDVDIAISVLNVLHWMSYFPKDAVKVAVNDGWITLSGAVEWEFQKQAVRGALRFLIGVKGVNDHILVQAVTPTPKTNVVIMATAPSKSQFDEQCNVVQLQALG